MGILDTDIGYQIGLLAGGLWAERYRQRGEEKANQTKPYFNKDLAYQKTHEYVANTVPGLRNFYSKNPFNNQR